MKQYAERHQNKQDTPNMNERQVYGTQGHKPKSGQKRAVNRKIAPICVPCMKNRTSRKECENVLAYKCPSFCTFGPFVKKTYGGSRKITQQRFVGIYDLLSHYGLQRDERYDFFYDLPGLGFGLETIQEMLDVMFPEPAESDYGPAREWQERDDDF